MVRVMMREMMAAEKLAPPPHGDEVMHVVVRSVVKKVPDDEAGEGRLADCPPHHAAEERVEDESEWGARQERHDEPVLVVWVLVMNAVQKKMNAPAPRLLVRPVKDVAVQPVLRDRPHGDPGKERGRYRHRRQIVPPDAADQEQ